MHTCFPIDRYSDLACIICEECWKVRREALEVAAEQARANLAAIMAKNEKIKADLAKSYAALRRAGVDAATLAAHGIVLPEGRASESIN